jgi:hypothetical protein
MVLNIGGELSLVRNGGSIAARRQAACLARHTRKTLRPRALVANVHTFPNQLLERAHRAGAYYSAKQSRLAQVVAGMMPADCRATRAANFNALAKLFVRNGMASTRMSRKDGGGTFCLSACLRC